MLEEIIKVLRENERVLLLEIHEISVSVLYIVQRTDQSDWVEKRLQCELQWKPYRLHLIREKIYIYIKIQLHHLPAELHASDIQTNIGR